MRANAVDLGYTANGNSPLDILKRIDGSGGGGGALSGLTADLVEGDSMGVRERYKSLVRQLPARTFLDQLMEIYDRDINWQYCGLDMPILQELVDRWYDVPFSLLNSSGPQGLDPMLRALPALMFQLMASSLLYLPDSAHDNFNSLKYANMSFDDLALEYSESGVAVLSLLGKRQMSIVTVLAGWVRAGFLKYTGQVTEAVSFCTPPLPLPLTPFPMCLSVSSNLILDSGIKSAPLSGTRRRLDYIATRLIPSLRHRIRLMTSSTSSGWRNSEGASG